MGRKKKIHTDPINTDLELRNDLLDFKSKWLSDINSVIKPEINLNTTDIKNITEADLFGEYGPPVSPREFCESNKFMGNCTTNQFYPWLIDTMEQIFSGRYYAPKYNTAVIMAGKGSGKSYLSSLCACYMWYFLLSFKSFSLYMRTLGVQFASDSVIFGVGLAKSTTQVKEVFYNQTAKFINQTQAFRQRGWLPASKIKSSLRYMIKDPVTGTELDKLVFLPGNSSATFALGYNVFFGVIDETEFFAERNSDPVEGIYTELNNRRITRFGDNGIIILISSATVDNTFTTGFKKKSIEDDRILFIRKSTYECKPSYFHLPKFEFKVKHERGDGTIEDLTLNPPEILRKSYETDPYNTLRDWDAIPALAGSPFYADYMLLSLKVNKNRVDPCPDLGILVPEGPQEAAKRLEELPHFRGIPGVSYRIHIDLARGDVAKGNCACGFAMVHKLADEQLGFKVYLDLSLRFKAAAGKEIQIPEVLAFVKFLKDTLKFNIDMVTFDQWQSYMAMQIINGWNNGIRSDELKVDRKHHTMLKTLIYGGQFDMYEDYNLLYEIKRLEDFGTVIDHAAGSFKDEVDAVAGAAFASTSLECTSQQAEAPPTRPTRGVLTGGSGRNGVSRSPGTLYKQDYLSKFHR